MGALRKGITKSCGCFMNEAKRASKPCKWKENHSYVGTRLYKIWGGMKNAVSIQRITPINGMVDGVLQFVMSGKPDLSAFVNGL